MTDTTSKMVVSHILTGEIKEVLSGASFSSWYTCDFIEVGSKASLAKADVLSKRDALLAATDWMALSDVQMTTEMQEYRQALRDLPSQAGFPDNVTWPTLGATA